MFGTRMVKVSGDKASGNKASGNKASGNDRLEWLETLASCCGVGLWDAVFHEGDALHPKARWTWSAEFRRLCGYATVGEFPDVVQSWSDRLHPEDAPATFAAFGNSCKSGAGYDVTYRLKVRDGSYRWFRATGGVVLDKSGRPRRACGSLVDIDAGVRGEAERAVLQQRLAEKFEQRVSVLIDTLCGCATGLETAAVSMNATVGETNQRSVSVADAVGTVGRGTQSVSAASNELTASIGEIARRVDAATAVTDQAVSDARQTDTIMKDLTDAAGKIGHVAGLISRIASQTNLLALNATIEAARAGEAGKGFAVVASEVKGLAKQTSDATEEIDQQIRQIQSATSRAVKAIGDITVTIEQVSTISTAIAAAVQQQGTANAEIARNVAQTFEATQAVASNSNDLQRASGESGTTAVAVLQAATDMSRRSKELSSEVTRFLADVRAA